MAGLITHEDEKENFFGSIKKRIPWLITLLILGLLVSSVISAFTDIIAEVTAAVLFQSVVLGMAGNGGTQALAVTLTTLTQDDDINRKKVMKMLGKEWSKEEYEQLNYDLTAAKCKVFIEWNFSVEEIAKIMSLPEAMIQKMISE